MANSVKEFEQLTTFFSKAKLPADITLEPGVYIPDVQKFVVNNLKALGTGEMNEVAATGRYYRMNQLKELLSKK